MKESLEYKAGYNCGKNGANTINCYFEFFSTPEKTKEWERSKTDAEHENLN